uniref:Putative F-box/LRR-repeat protein 12 n=1 Tax=Davidia involucrata TaxID=16924 RepID=A0A5B7BQ23_DAVIN
MENPSRDGPTSIMHLPDDCLYFIFQRLDYGFDRESFGLTCHRWLHIQNSSRRSLQFQCSFTQLNLTSLSQASYSINSFHLYRLLNRFQQLESLSLSGCIELPDSGLTQLQYYGSKLHALYLDCCFGITDNGLLSVATGCHSLTAVSLYRSNISDIGLEILAKSCLALKDVNLSYCSLISDYGISTLSQKCYQLRAIRISYCGRINGVGFKGCSQTLAYLEADSCKLEPEGILGIVSGGGLEYLNVSNLPWSICGDGLTALGAGFATKLRILNFRTCRTIGDNSVVAIAKGCPLLQEWNLALCHEVRISGWESIGLNCHNLERLHVNRCRNLCDHGFQALRDGCKRLSILYMSRCRRITSIAVELFKCSRGDVKIKEEEIMCIAPNWAFQR